MRTFSDYTSIIEAAIEHLHWPGGRVAPLYYPIEYGLQAGGKRLRPVLTLMAYDAFSGEDISRAVDAAIGIEMFHNFTLLHDDVMDNSEVRRGRPSVMAKYGVNAAILSGDTMLTLATEQVMQVPDAVLRQVLDCFNKTAIEVYEGQQLDIDFEQRDDVTLSEYMEMIRLKTSVLLGCAAKVGALMAQTSPERADAIYRYAEQLGIAFQIMDDMLDVYGDAAAFGKPIGGDIVNDKKTFLYLTALNSPQGAELLKAQGLSDAKEKIAHVRAIYDELNMKEICKAEIEKYTSQALAALNEAALSPEANEAFTDLANKLIDRNK